MKIKLDNCGYIDSKIISELENKIKAGILSSYDRVTNLVYNPNNNIFDVFVEPSASTTYQHYVILERFRNSDYFDSYAIEVDESIDLDSDYNISDYIDYCFSELIIDLQEIWHEYLIEIRDNIYDNLENNLPHCKFIKI